MKKNYNNEKYYGKLYGVLWQFAVIALFVAAFFTAAFLSPLDALWEPQTVKVMQGGFVVSIIVLVLLFATSILAAYREAKVDGWGNFAVAHGDVIGAGLMLMFHYIIRIKYIGTIQTNEGLTSYLSLKNLSLHPELIWQDFSQAGKLAGRNAYGYNFLALIGEFILPGTGFGFEWVQLFMGVAAACCLYGIFRRMFPRLNTYAAWTGALVVSVQPLFLGLSGICGLEYGITVFFLYALYSCISRKYVLMAFWLVVLGTTKGTGTVMALSFLGIYMGAEAFSHIKRARDKGVSGKAAAKAGGTFSEGAAAKAGETPSEGAAAEIGGTSSEAAAAGTDGAGTSDEDAGEGPEIDFKSVLIAAGAFIALCVFAWAVIKICRANGIALSYDYIKIKLMQLFLLNFNWIWTVIVVIGACMVIANFRVRRTHRIELSYAAIIVGCYIVHLAYLIAYTRAGLPRYNMLSDVLFAMMGVCLLIKMFERTRALVPVLVIIGLCMFGESSVTIDPVTSDSFSILETGAFPIVTTAYAQSDRPDYKSKIGDFSFYNGHFIFEQQALDSIIEGFDRDEGDIIVFSNYQGAETTQGDEVLIWDKMMKSCRYASCTENIDLCRKVIKADISQVYDASLLPERAIFYVIPWGYNRTEATLRLVGEYYEAEGPMDMKVGNAGVIEYYYLTRIIHGDR